MRKRISGLNERVEVHYRIEANSECLINLWDCCRQAASEDWIYYKNAIMQNSDAPPFVRENDDPARNFVCGKQA